MTPSPSSPGAEPKLRILVVEDNEQDYRLALRTLSRAGLDCHAECVDSRAALIHALTRAPWHLVLLDYTVPGLPHHDVLAEINRHQPGLPAILLSGLIEEATAFELLKAGLWDYVSKDELARLPSVIERNLQEAENLRRLREAEQQARIAALAFESSDAIAIIDAQGRFRRVNGSFCAASGYTVDELVGRPALQLRSRRHNKRFYTALRAELASAGRWQGEMWMRNRDGACSLMWQTITAVLDSSGRLTDYVATGRDITARKAAEEEIARLAFYDALTGLPNRRLLVDRLGIALTASDRSAVHGALMFIDLDHFKDINDTLGHEEGDRLLIEAARRLTACVRADDTVARLGGDEFVVLLEALAGDSEEAATQARMVGEKIRGELGASFTLAGRSCRVTPSIGVALFAGAETSCTDLLRRADLAMYQAKTAGRDLVRFFDPEMQASVEKRASLERDLRRAIRQREFAVWYQPVVNRRGASRWQEALVRWINPEQGVLLPARFLPVAEASGLVMAIGDQVLEAVCARLGRLRANGDTHTAIAVNAGSKQLRNPFFADEIQARLYHHEANPSQLIVELTEGPLPENMADVRAKMVRLKALGVRFALDDFGTGYASLVCLRELPFDRVKIDTSFIRDLLEDPDDARLVSATIQMAHCMGIKVVAEGVEHQAQWDYLLRAGCDEAQGFLFGRPQATAD